MKIGRSIVLANLLIGIGFGATDVSFTTTPTGYIKDKSSAKLCLSNYNYSNPANAYVDYNYSYDNNGTWFDANGITDCVYMSLLSDGTHSVTVKAWTSDYNSSITSTYSNNTTSSSFVIDTTAPTSPTLITNTSMGGTTTTNATDINITTNGDLNLTFNSPLSSSDITYYRYYLNSKTYSNDINVTKFNTIELENLGDGTHTLYIWSKDLAGNEQSDTQRTKVNITVDSTKPTISTINYDAFTLKSALEVNVTTDENISNYKYDVNGTGFVTVANSPTDKGFDLSLSKTTGEYNISILVQDLYGNWSEEKNITIVNDTQSAKPKVYGFIPNGSGTYSINLYPAGERISKYKYSINDAPYSSTYNVNEANISLSNSLFANGLDHNITIISYDFDNNSYTETFKWKQLSDSNNSITFINLPTALTNSKTVNTTFSGVSGVNYSYELNGSNSFGISGFATTSGTISTTVSSDGDYNISIIAPDNNKTIYSFKVDSTEINSSSANFASNISKNGGITADNLLNFKLYAKDAIAYSYALNGNTYSSTYPISSNTISLTGLGANSYYSPISSSNLPNFGAGGTVEETLYQEMLNIKFLDLAGNWSSPIAFNYYIDNITPSFAISKADANETHTILNIKATSSDAKEFSYSLNSDTYSKYIPLNSLLEANVTFVNLKSGVHNFSAKVKDKVGNVASPISYSFSVGNASIPTVGISYIASQVSNLPNIGNAIYVGYPVSFDINDSTLTYYAWNFGDGTTSSSKNASKTYTQAGTYTVTFVGRYASGVETTTSQTISVGTLSSSQTSIPTTTTPTTTVTTPVVSYPVVETPIISTPIVTTPTIPTLSINGNSVTYSSSGYSNVTKTVVSGKDAVVVNSGEVTINLNQNTPLAVGQTLIYPNSSGSIKVLSGSSADYGVFNSYSKSGNRVVIIPTQKLTIDSNIVEVGESVIFEDGILKYIVYGDGSKTTIGNPINSSTLSSSYGLTINSGFLPYISGDARGYNLTDSLNEVISNKFGFNYKISQKSSGLADNNNALFGTLSLQPIGYIEAVSNKTPSITQNSDATLTVVTESAKVKLAPMIYDIDAFKAKFGTSTIYWQDNHIEFNQNSKRYSYRAYPFINPTYRSGEYYEFSSKKQYIYPASHMFNETDSAFKSLFGNSVSETFMGKIVVGNSVYSISPELIYGTQNQTVVNSGNTISIKYSDGYIQKFIKE